MSDRATGDCLGADPARRIPRLSDHAVPGSGLSNARSCARVQHQQRPCLSLFSAVSTWPRSQAPHRSTNSALSCRRRAARYRSSSSLRDTDQTVPSGSEGTANAAAAFLLDPEESGADLARRRAVCHCSRASATEHSTRPTSGTLFRAIAACRKPPREVKKPLPLAHSGTHTPGEVERFREICRDLLSTSREHELRDFQCVMKPA